jgi:cation diffusion facilitator CzcD-associated flavoprotein CzcO
MRFSSNVIRCEWHEERSRWRLTVTDIPSGVSSQHECQFLFAGTGILLDPRPLGIPGDDTFAGEMFHSARWRDDVSLQDKDVVVIGNGCTAAQIVPTIVGKTRSLTQFIRSKHWIMPEIDKFTVEFLRLTLKYIPGMTWAHRVFIYWAAEWELRGFYTSWSGEAFRKEREAWSKSYVKETAPEKYHDLLIPDFPMGCKRRVFDTGYLVALHSDNLTLTDDKILEIVPEGVRTEKGVVKADVIICANGFRTNDFLGRLEVVGREGKTPADHWKEYGGPEAYNCSVMRGFPNFFMILGKNDSAAIHSKFATLGQLGRETPAYSSFCLP